MSTTTLGLDELRDCAGRGSHNYCWFESAVVDKLLPLAQTFERQLKAFAVRLMNLYDYYVRDAMSANDWSSKCVCACLAVWLLCMCLRGVCVC